MKTLAFLVLLCSSSLAQQQNTAFKTTLTDSALVKVLRSYISKEQSKGIVKGRTVIGMLHISLGNPDITEWHIKATNTMTLGHYQIPALLSEIDGYPVLIHFPGDMSKFVEYSSAYRAFFDQYVLSRVNQPSERPPLDSFAAWRVIFTKGKEPDIRVSL